MIIYRQVIISSILFLLVVLQAFVLQSDAAEGKQITSLTSQPIFDLSFADSGPSTNPLVEKGFCPIIHQGRVIFRVDSGNLCMTAGPGSRMLYSLAINPVHAGRIRIAWGVHRFPQGVDWDNGPTKREPLGVAISFGDKMAPKCSDATSIVGIIMRALSRLQRMIDPPQTVVIFLGRTRWHNRMLEGNLYRKQIRYLCQDFQQPDSAGCLISEFSIDTLYQRAFKVPYRQTPRINAVSLETDLDGLVDSSSVFLKAIELLP